VPLHLLCPAWGQKHGKGEYHHRQSVLEINEHPDRSCIDSALKVREDTRAGQLELASPMGLSAAAMNREIFKNR